MYSQLIRWTASLVISFALCSQIIGCNKSDSGKTTDAPKTDTAPAKAKFVIGVSLLTLTNPFFKEIGDTLVAEGAKHGFDVVVTSGDQDPAKQKDQVKNFLVQKVSAIVLSPCDSNSIGTAITDANAAGIPVFTADIACTATGVKIASHCATDNLEGGRIAGRAIVDALGGHGKVAIINHPEVETGLMREKGCLEELAKAPGIQVVAELASEGARDRAFSAAQDILQSHPNIDAIFAINDPSALGAMAALEKAGKLHQIKIIGFDGQIEARHAIMEGKIYATIMQYPSKIAATTIDSISKYMAGDEVPPVC